MLEFELATFVAGEELGNRDIASGNFCLFCYIYSLFIAGKTCKLDSVLVDITF